MARYYADEAFRARVLSDAHNRRADRLGLTEIRTPRDLVTYLVERDGGRCQITACLLADRRVLLERGPAMASVDHIVPLSKGGEHTVDNLQLAHFRCNLSKGNRLDAAVGA